MPANENTRKNRLAFGAEIVTYDDARRAAKRRLPRMIYDFIDGAAGRETAPARNRAGFDAVNLQPRALRNVTERCLKTHLLGQVFDAPFGIAPMGMCGLTYPGADQIMADQCTARNIPLGLSTAASIPLENMRQLAGDNAWFQLYASGSTEQTMSFVERAKQAGYQKLILTVDVPQVSRRVRDHKNGFEVPFRIGPKQFLDFALHPQWSLSMLWHGIPETANYKHPNSGGFDRNSSRAGADWTFLDQLRQVWSGELIIKGVTSTEDARHIQAAGADAIWVSNHGGRQLDSAPSSVTLLPPIRAAVGPNYPVIFDSGVRHGEDVIKAL
ncbi:MAG: alpha-hydroxy-acid oxidizing protein, partial [Marinovum sp.]|nr:alpha-hydroxy-acid oxidizing protein [Marinovum sp.]